MIKPKLLLSLLIILPIAVFASEVGNEALLSNPNNDEISTSGIVEHDNVLCAATQKEKVSMSIQYINHSITKGQNFDHVINAPAGGKNDGCIIVRAGRKKSTGVVDDTKKLAGVNWSEYNMGVTDSANKTGHHDKTPNELNFAVKVNLTFTFQNGSTHVCRNVIIAQGSSAAMNNWWLISNINNEKSKDPYVEISCDNGTVYFYKYGYMLSPAQHYLDKNTLQVSDSLL